MQSCLKIGSQLAAREGRRNYTDFSSGDYAFENWRNTLRDLECVVRNFALAIKERSNRHPPSEPMLQKYSEHYHSWRPNCQITSQAFLSPWGKFPSYQAIRWWGFLLFLASCFTRRFILLWLAWLHAMIQWVQGNMVHWRERQKLLWSTGTAFKLVLGTTHLSDHVCQCKKLTIVAEALSCRARDSEYPIMFPRLDQASVDLSVDLPLLHLLSNLLYLLSTSHLCLDRRNVWREILFRHVWRHASMEPNKVFKSVSRAWYEHVRWMISPSSLFFPVLLAFQAHHAAMIIIMSCTFLVAFILLSCRALPMQPLSVTLFRLSARAIWSFRNPLAWWLILHAVNVLKDTTFQTSTHSLGSWCADGKTAI